MEIPNAQKTILENGVKVITEDISGLRSTAIGILIKSGSGDELPKEEGLTHFIEHMAFKGTLKRSAFKIAQEIDAIGGKINAYTSKEYTVYYSVVLDKHIDIAIDVLSDIFLNPLLKEEDIQLEKGVILEEINMYEDTPDELIHDLFIDTILHGHPKGKPTLGTKETVSSFKKDSFLKYRERLYKPDNVVIAAAGSLNHETILNKVLKFFNKFDGKGIVSNPPTPLISSELKVKNKKTEQVHLCLGTKGLGQLDDNRFTLSILDTILGGSMSSWLFQEIREKRGLAYSVYSTSSAFLDFGVFYVYAGTDKKNTDQIIGLILEQFKKMKKEGISKEELSWAKEHLKGQLVLGLESSSSRMSYIAKSEFYHNRIISFDEIFNKIDKVTSDDIIILANECFKNEFLTLAIIGDLENHKFKGLSC